jgi:hypothetical protein
VNWALSVGDAMLIVGAALSWAMATDGVAATPSITASTPIHGLIMNTL